MGVTSVRGIIAAVFVVVHVVVNRLAVPGRC